MVPDEFSSNQNSNFNMKGNDIEFETVKEETHKFELISSENSMNTY